MGYLECKKCGGIYELQEGESPDDYDVCYCGGEIEYHTSHDELTSRQEYAPTDGEITKKKSNRNLIIIIIASIFLIFLILSVIAPLLMYQNSFTGPSNLTDTQDIHATRGAITAVLFLSGI
ncbi:MAG TPA: hypothetical protein VK444_08480 [Methanobacteriaceae archaeon]|nr:hypothetical protein [Methanobacteriaceae archaeon]